jgi:dimethylargininase
VALVAITRSPGPELTRCELTHLERRPIDVDRALAQHRAYQGTLRGAGIEVVELPSDPSLPDGVFVEDTALVLDELAVITSPSPPSRREEWHAIEAALRPFRPLVRLPAGAYLEGGDVLRVGRTLYVGQGGRTSEAGLRELDALVRPLGYAVAPVRLGSCLHLKSACGALDGATLLVNRAWLEPGALSGHRLVDVPAEEPWGANVLPLPGATLVSAACPRTADLVHGLGHPTVALDVSELHKAEAGLTCMSLLFGDGPAVRSPFSAARAIWALNAAE